MAKKRTKEELSREQILGLARYFEGLSNRLKDVAEKMVEEGAGSISVTGLSTFERGRGYIEGWLSNVQKEASELALSDLKSILQQTAEIEANIVVEESKARQSKKKPNRPAPKKRNQS